MIMPVEIDGEEYLTTNEAMTFLDVSYPTLAKLRERYGLIPKKRGVKSTQYYQKSELAKILELRDAPREEEEEA